jgi:SPP1 family predicted phage head-tail adaptor
MTRSPLSLPAGSLRHSISFEKRSTTTDSFGQPIESWNSVLTTRAAIDMATEKELYQTGLITSQVTHIITIRWPGILVSVTPGMRIRFGSHVYTVQAVDNVSERNRVVRIFALELNGAD